MKIYKIYWRILLLSFLSSCALTAQNQNQIQAIIVSDTLCLGNAIIVPLEVDNFDSVAKFQLQITYNTINLTCEAFMNIPPQLGGISAFLDPVNGQITLLWQDAVPVTFPQKETLAELVFTFKNPGVSELSWRTGPNESYFANIVGDTLPAQFHNGEIIIYEPPEITLLDSKTVNVGDTVLITGLATSNFPPLFYQWTYPNGKIETDDPYFAGVTLADAGYYILMVRDALGCTDQKSIYLEVLPSSYGIKENIASRMVIYPNPGDGLFEVRLKAPPTEKVQLKVANAVGTIVYQRKNVVVTAAGQINIDLSNFSDGVYFLKITSKDTVLQEKLILRHN